MTSRRALPTSSSGVIRSRRRRARNPRATASSHGVKMSEPLPDGGSHNGPTSSHHCAASSSGSSNPVAPFPPRSAVLPPTGARSSRSRSHVGPPLIQATTILLKRQSGFQVTGAGAGGRNAASCRGRWHRSRCPNTASCQHGIKILKLRDPVESQRGLFGTKSAVQIAPDCRVVRVAGDLADGRCDRRRRPG